MHEFIEHTIYVILTAFNTLFLAALRFVSCELVNERANNLLS